MYEISMGKENIVVNIVDNALNVFVEQFESV